MRVLIDPRAARFVTDPTSFRFLRPFMGRERFASDVAGEVGVSVGAVSYRIRQMTALELITVVRTVARAGRPMRSYRAVSNDVFAPMDLTPTLSLGELIGESRLPGEKDIRDAVERAWLRVSREQSWGTHAYLVDAQGTVNRDFVPISLVAGESFWHATLADDAPAVWDQIATLNLAREDAKSLQRELAGVVSRYARSGPAGSPHLLHLALAPAQ